MAEKKKETKGSEETKTQEEQAQTQGTSRFPDEVVTEEDMTKIGERRLPDEPEPEDEEKAGEEEGKKEPEKETKAEKEKAEEAAASKKKEEEGKAEEKGEDEAISKGLDKRFGEYTKNYNELKRQNVELSKKLDDLTTAVALGKAKPPEGGEEEEAAEEIPEPKEEDYDDWSAYQKACDERRDKLTDRKIEMATKKARKEWEEAAAQEKKKAAQEAFDRELNEKLKSGREKHEDFDEVIEQELFTPTMKEAIFSSDQAAEIAYHLGKNPEKAGKIANAVAIAISNLEAELSSSSKSESTEPTEPEEEKSSQAPEPVESVSGAETVEKSLDEMSHAEFDAEMTRREKAQKT